MSSVYVIKNHFGDCRICGKHKDLRCGACFNCAKRVNGEKFGTDANGLEVHKLWDQDNPTNSWLIRIDAPWNK